MGIKSRDWESIGKNVSQVKEEGFRETSKMRLNLFILLPYVKIIF